MSGYDIGLDRTKVDPLNIMLDNINEKSTVLEFGCANGRMTKYMSETLKCSVDIVEYDEELFNVAIQYANDGILGDISDFCWKDKFLGKKYDYIIFADVLEHLRNPKEVLGECSQFLNDNGVIWVSVPNIAHNDIIINLIEDRFEYSETGLLDKTHIHFFTRESAKKMFAEVGLYVAYEDGIFVRSFCSEQLLPIKPEWKWYYDELLRRDSANLYQCVFALTLNSKIVMNLQNYMYWEQQKEVVERRIYFDCGEGFRDSLFSWEEIKNQQLLIEVDVPPKAKMVWVCPAFRRRFIIKNLKIEVDGQDVDYCNIRAEKHGSDYYFQSLEGDIYIDAVKDRAKLVITGEIILDVEFEKERCFEEIDSAQRREKQLLDCICKKDDQFFEKDEQIRMKDEQLREKDEQIRMKDEQLREKDGQICMKDERLREKEEQILKATRSEYQLLEILAEKEKCILTQAAECEKMTIMLAEGNRQIEDCQTNISVLQEEIQEFRMSTVMMQNELEKREYSIMILEQEKHVLLERIKQIENTLVWKVMSSVKKVIKKFRVKNDVANKKQ